MLILTNTSTDKLQLTTSAAATVHVIASWIDLAADGSGDPTPGRSLTAISTATTTDIVATPASTKVRNVKELTITNYDASLSCNVTPIFDNNGTDYKVGTWTLGPGDTLEYIEGVGWFKIAAQTVPLIGRVLTADDAGGAASATVQPWFPTNGALSVAAATTYWMRGYLAITSGATSHSTGLSFGGTATLTSIDYYAQAHRSAANTIIAVFSGFPAAVATNVTVDVAGVQAAHYIQVAGTVRINAAGTLIPQFTFSVNPTGTITIKRNSFFWLQAVGDNAVDKIGTWA